MTLHKPSPLDYYESDFVKPRAGVRTLLTSRVQIDFILFIVVCFSRICFTNYHPDLEIQAYFTIKLRAFSLTLLKLILRVVGVNIVLLKLHRIYIFKLICGCKPAIKSIFHTQKLKIIHL